MASYPIINTTARPKMESLQSVQRRNTQQTSFTTRAVPRLARRSRSSMFENKYSATRGKVSCGRAGAALGIVADRYTLLSAVGRGGLDN